ncbi:MAG: aminotransferase class I/II-fold pyridoxal phosphate-dependent enzyme, partial [Ferruginibacter sp.]
IKLYGDGEMFEPADYLRILQEANVAQAITRDRYGAGGAVEELEKKFCEITGKEAAIFLPSGTLANQLALAILSGEKTKVFVQDSSHIYRDEADAAQSVFGKRLMPLAKDKTYFTAEQLGKAVENLKDEEVFESGVGAVAIENPVRRTDGRMIPIEEIKKISRWCKDHDIKLHMDGARIYMASAWSGIPVKEFAVLTDSIYISLYKYLGAGAGAILCGSKSMIEKIPHLMKIHGAAMYNNWTNAAMALYRLKGLEQRLADAKQRSAEIFGILNNEKDFKVTALDGGTNIYKLSVLKKVDSKKMQEILRNNFGVIMQRLDEKNEALITVNETLLYQDAGYVVGAFKAAVK